MSYCRKELSIYGKGKYPCWLPKGKTVQEVYPEDEDTSSSETVLT
jgi:hypothetical protein